MAGLNSDQTPLAEIMPALQTSTTRTATVGGCRNAATKRIETVAAGAHEIGDLRVRVAQSVEVFVPTAGGRRVNEESDNRTIGGVFGWDILGNHYDYGP